MKSEIWHHIKASKIFNQGIDNFTCYPLTTIMENQIFLVNTLTDKNPG